MNTNRHEYRWTCLAATTSRDEGRERGRPARTTLAQPHPFLPPGSTGNGATIPLQPSPCGFRRQGGRVPHHGKAERPPNPEDAGETPALPEGRLLPSFLLREEALPLSMLQGRPASCPFVVLRVSSVKHPIVNRGEPRMNTNRHEFQWTSLAATPSREEGRERGRPARTTLAQPHPSPPPGSTGNGARIPLQPSPWGSRRQGGRVPHHGETERPPNAEDAGGTPALPGGAPLPSVFGDHSFFAINHSYWCSFVFIRGSWFSFVDHSSLLRLARRPPLIERPLPRGRGPRPLEDGRLKEPLR